MKALRIFCLGLILTAVTTVWAAPDVLMEIYNPNTDVTSYVAAKEAHTYLKGVWKHKSTTKGAHIKMQVSKIDPEGHILTMLIEPNEMGSHSRDGWKHGGTFIMMYDPTGLRESKYVPTNQIGDHKAEGWDIYTG